ncbi:MAG: protein kinase [Halanaerobiales bacterium]|nr:protein kinase [Halanaerobiales bacterium]
MADKYIKYEKENKEVIAEKIFVNKKPRSRVMLSTVKEIKNELQNYSYENEDIIDFKSVERIDREYYLISDGDKYYPSLIEKLEGNNIDIKTIAKWALKIFEIWSNIEGKNEFPSEVKLNYFRVDEDNNLKLVNPFINKKIEQYKYKDLNKEYNEIYRPPEVINGSEWEQSARIYNFGVILYYLIVGKFPFQGKDKTEMYDKKMTGSIIAPRFLNPDISKNFSELVDKMLTNDKNKRLSSFDEIINQLKNLINNNNIEADSQERKQNLDKSGSQFKKKRLKDGFIFFFRHHWGKVLIVLAAGFMLVGVGMLGGNPPVVTEQTTPEEVVKYFYDSIDKKDPVVIDQTTTVDLDRLSTMVSEGHVMESMRTAYQSLPQEEKEQENNKVFGIKNLTINTSKRDQSYVFETSYIFYYPRDEKMREKEMKDTLIVEQVENKWQITKINGDVVDLIEGKFED